MYSKETATEWAAIRNAGHWLLEKPAIYQACGDVTGKKVLCAGCGFGEECSELIKRRAGEVVGIDSSETCLQNAREKHPAIPFELRDMRNLDGLPENFDLIFSSLSIHYIEDWTSLLKVWSRHLRPGGEIVFSTHHPMAWGGERFENALIKRERIGFEIDKMSGKTVFFGSYLEPRKIKTKLGQQVEVECYHKPLGAIFSEIRAADLSVEDFQEPLPVEAPGMSENERLFCEVRRKFPLFVVFRLKSKT